MLSNSLVIIKRQYQETELKTNNVILIPSISAEPPLFTMATQAAPTASSVGGKDDGWDFGSDWGSFDPPAAPSKPPHKQPAQESGGGGGAASRQELLAKRREERRLKQQAAREKRAAAGAPLKPGGLGALKKD